MNKFPYPRLFEPLQLRGVLFRNRIFAAPTGYRNMTYDSVFPPEAVLYYSRKAMGGAASVSSGELVTDTEIGRGGPHHVCIDNPQAVIPLGKIAYAIHRYGAVPTAELQHAGMYANRDLRIFGGESRGDAYGPVETTLEGRLVREMPEELIEHTIAKYAKAAETAKYCGFEMILIHAGHGWLLQQFLSPQINKRKDKWGGPDIENRARFTVAVCDAVRKAIGPKMPIEVRISGSECYDGGYGIEEGIAFARQLEEHVDLIQVSVGSHEIKEAFTRTHPSVFEGEGCNVRFAAEVKKHVKTPVAAIGAIGEPDMMEEIIASGQADVVELARSLIADPDLPNKIRSGKTEEIMPCLRCLHCFSTQMRLGVKHCAVNPESGREIESRFASRQTGKRKKVLVAGGGIAGMQAALTCAESGHTVILCEKSGELGGAIRCERNVPFKKKTEQYIETQIQKIKRSGIELRLNTEVTPELAEKINADVIFAALGARATIPPIPGIDGASVLGAESAYMHPEKVGKTAVILGAGLVGLELAVYLSGSGKNVTVIEMTDQISDGGNILHMQGLQVELERRGIAVLLSTAAYKISEKGVFCRNASGERLYEADTVIYATGMAPLREEALALSFAAPLFYMPGDCVTPKNIADATDVAHSLALNVGRL
ncbi:MAG: NAD(P)/FAD-dependent oxidoreductase [Oscillospiraceae bacterium]|nr:NAD(P)/FAD-dependent oxidoreductase [Oscillospiraceae bacterium]